MIKKIVALSILTASFPTFAMTEDPCGQFFRGHEVSKSGEIMALQPSGSGGDRGAGLVSAALDRNQIAKLREYLKSEILGTDENDPEVSDSVYTEGKVADLKSDTLQESFADLNQIMHEVNGDNLSWFAKKFGDAKQSVSDRLQKSSSRLREVIRLVRGEVKKRRTDNENFETEVDRHFGEIEAIDAKLAELLSLNEQFEQEIERRPDLTEQQRRTLRYTLITPVANRMEELVTIQPRISS